MERDGEGRTRLPSRVRSLQPRNQILLDASYVMKPLNMNTETLWLKLSLFSPSCSVHENSNQSSDTFALASRHFSTITTSV